MALFRTINSPEPLPPIVGDGVYRRGTRHGLAFARQALHAVELSLVHPGSGKTVTWHAQPPADFQKLLKSLRR